VDERVLIVEDDASIREVTAIGLKNAGYRVTTAGDGREGLMRSKQAPFDLVILDVMLPTLDGFEVCRQIRHESRVPILMLTARSDTLDVVVGLESGADDYVTKPFGRQELLARVETVLRRAGGGALKETYSDSVLTVDFGERRLSRLGLRELPTKLLRLLQHGHRAAPPGQRPRGGQAEQAGADHDHITALACLVPAHADVPPQVRLGPGRRHRAWRVSRPPR